MRKLIAVALVLVAFAANAQDQYKKGMTKAFDLWRDGKNTEAAAMFERIGSAEKDNWLPAYYVAMINATSSFQSKDPATVNALLTKAQSSIDPLMEKYPNNPEIMVIQALIYTGWVAFDPMTNGMKMSGKIMELYSKAEAIAPNNPRVVFGKAEYEIGGAKFFGKDIKPMCDQVTRSIGLFEKFVPESEFAPTWGLDRALEMQKECAAK